MNELSGEAHNAFVKCFASVEKENRKAFAFLRTMGIQWLKGELLQFISGLYTTRLKGEFIDMNYLTVEEMMEIGKEMGNLFLNDFEVEDLVKKFELTDILSLYETKDVMLYPTMSRKKS